MQDNILGTEKISKLFVKFSFPAILSLTIVGIQTYYILKEYAPND